jgi:serine/threonine protein kinase
MSTVPSHIGRYQIQGAIGQGGMGSLFKAWDPKLDRQVAIKVIRGDDDDLRARFTREAQAAAHLRHPNIVTIFDVGEEQGQPFMAMEFIQGQTLAELIQKRTSIELSRKLELMEALCDGLGFAHRAGIVHRDVKPANVMVDGEGALKVLDFGIARLVEGAGTTRAGVLIGTLNYMAPERIAGQPLDARSDIFAVGLVLYEFLAYRPAFPGSQELRVLQAILNEPPAPIAEVAGVTPEIVRIVDRALAKDPTQRYQDLATMRHDLQGARSQLLPTAPATVVMAAPEPARPPTVPPPPPRPSSIQPKYLGFAALLSVAAGGAAYLATRHASTSSTTNLSSEGPATTSAAGVTPTPSPLSSSPSRQTALPAPPSTPSPPPAAQAGRATGPTEVPPEPDEVVALRTAREAYARKDRALALLSIQHALELRSGYPEAQQTLHGWLTTANAESRQARMSAEIAGRSPTNSPKYADAASGVAEAKTLEGTHPDQSLLKVWEATNLFRQAAVEPTRETPPAPQAPAESGPSHPASAASSSGAVSTEPAPDPAALRRVEQPAIDRAIDDYRLAFDARDLAALKKTFPTAPSTYKELFDSMNKVSIQFRDAKTEYNDGLTTATVQTAAVLAVSPKNGFAQSTTVQRVFSLQKVAGTWTIISVTDRASGK